MSPFEQFSIVKGSRCPCLFELWLQACRFDVLFEVAERAGFANLRVLVNQTPVNQSQVILLGLSAQAVWPLTSRGNLVFGNAWKQNHVSLLPLSNLRQLPRSSFPGLQLTFLLLIQPFQKGSCSLRTQGSVFLAWPSRPSSFSKTSPQRLHRCWGCR